MIVGHIVIVVNEIHPDKDPQIQFSYSGGDEFKGDKAKQAFDLIKEGVEQLFNVVEESKSDNYLK